jgi:hypothetical protein
MEAQAPPARAAGPEGTEGPDPGDRPDDPRGLAGYVTLVGAFGGMVAAATVAAKVTGREVPERVSPLDVAMASLATHKLSRLIAKEKVTRFARAPFTEVRAEPRPGGRTLKEKPRNGSVRGAVGELLLCPYCLDQWLAAGFTAGLVLAPRPTRLVAATYSAEAIADFLHVGWLAARRHA